MKGRRNPFVAREGLPWLVAVIALGVAVWQFFDLIWLVVPAVLLLWFYAIFRDPRRHIPAAPLGVVSPVDGTVASVTLTDNGVLGGEAHSVVIDVNSLGTYTARCPVEGKIMDFRGNGNGDHVRRFSTGLWVRTDEGEDVILQFHRFRLGLAPRAILGYGERVGQGQRCAYMRLAKKAEVQFSLHGRVLVEPGQPVVAGTDLIGKLPHS